MIFIVAPNDHSQMSQRRDMEWLYIGSHNGLSMASGVLQISKRLFIGRDIESIVEAVRENFVDYIGKVSQLQKDRVLWYSSRVASDIHISSVCIPKAFGRDSSR